MTKIEKPAAANATLHPIISGRFSPRIYDSTALLTQAEIESLGEAFRWAPSSNNQQPWQVVFLNRGSQLFAEISERGLTGFNQSWAPSASLYAIVLAKQLQEGQPRNQAATYFDVGLASQQMVLQAESMGLRSHYMGGIVHEEIAKILGVKDHWVVCIITIGKQGDIEAASAEVAERESAPRARRASESVYQVDAKLG